MMHTNWISLFVLSGFLWLPSLIAQQPESRNDSERLEFFESKVRPLLLKHCLDCHSRSFQAFS